MSLQPGDDVAVQWIASEFARAGLAPAATDARGRRSCLQAVPLIEYRPDAQATRVTLKRQGQSTQRKTPEVSGGFPENRAITDAPVEFAGYGIAAPALGYDDYAGLDVKGKVVAKILRLAYRSAASSPTKRRRRGSIPIPAGTRELR